MSHPNVDTLKLIGRYRNRLRSIRDKASDPKKATTITPMGVCRTTVSTPDYCSVQLEGYGSKIALVFNRADLYVQGFIINGKGYKFNDASWNISATLMGYGGSYKDMGWDRTKPHTPFDLNDVLMAIDCVANCDTPKKWKENINHVRILVIAFAEGARMYTVEKDVIAGNAIKNLDWNANNGNVLALIKG